MTSSPRPSLNADAIRALVNRTLDFRRRLELAPECPNTFIETCFDDSTGLPLLQADVHRELQAFLTNHTHALIELPRDHGKSMQVCMRILWELGRVPNLRIKIVCASDAMAAERTRFLRDAIAGNRKLRRVFPQLLPGEPWAAEAFTVQRHASAIGPSVAAFGIGTSATGARADLLICDDVVDVKAISSAWDRHRTKEYFRNNLLNLLEPDGRFWGLCTPWHPNDLNAELKSNPAYALFRRAIGPDLEPVWPEKWDEERLAMRRAEIGEAGFARGYRLVPMAEDELLIKPEWIREYESIGLPEKVILSIDPAVTASAKADASAIVVLGRMPGVNEVRVLEAVGHRLAMPDLVKKMEEAVERWQPEEILFESNAAFKGIHDLLVRHASFGNKVKGVVQSKSKAARFAAFAVSVQNGSVRFRKESQTELIDEMTSFPNGAHDDLLDATATGVEHLFGKRDPRMW